jgi:hypothetical protein
MDAWRATFVEDTSGSAPEELTTVALEGVPTAGTFIGW